MPWVHSQNPYALTFPNLYSPEQVQTFYGPGVVAGGRVTYGLPYPPVSALWAIPGYLLGDVRLSGLAALSVLALVLSGPRASRRSRALAVLFVVAPSALFVIFLSWTEPSLVALLGLAVWAMTSRRMWWAAVFLGLLLVSKQYLVVALPVLWLLRPVTRRQIAIVVASGAAITLPFVLANPHAFARSVLEFQLIQPFRADSLSLLVFSVNHLGRPGPGIYNVLPVAAGLLVATVFALTTRPGPAQFATGVGLSLLVTVLLSKQAFTNYYFLVGGAFLVAAWAADRAPVVEPTSARAAEPVEEGQQQGLT